MGDYVWVFQELVSSKGTRRLQKKWRGQFQRTEVLQGGGFYFEIFEPRNASAEDWSITTDIPEDEYSNGSMICEQIKKESDLKIQEVDESSIEYISRGNTKPNWVTPDGPLCVP